MLIIQPISVSQTYLLRHQVLRPTTPPEECIFDCDINPSVFHLGAIRTGDNNEKIQDNQIVGIATFFIEPFQKRNNLFVKGNSTMLIKEEFSKQCKEVNAKKTWRLRGMATASSVRGLGVGTQVLAAGLEHIKSQQGELLWCNARTTATKFYSNQGFIVGSNSFNIDGIGPHCIMYKYL